ncbi:hypothetical protein BaRGS_00001768 [Batillaria attramentaria]|uniref:Uncharacterized protein n=1 Tax=Batillaria attramentaria TaxID=370345 RepID=A0ABD0M5Z0_9CAEN
MPCQYRESNEASAQWSTPRRGTWLTTEGEKKTEREEEKNLSAALSVSKSATSVAGKSACSVGRGASSGAKDRNRYWRRNDEVVYEKVSVDRNDLL